MQAGRELDAKVADALGWKTAIDGDGTECWEDQKGCLREATFSTTWGGMGVLVEEALTKQDILLDYDTYMDAFVGRARRFKALDNEVLQAALTAPHAICLTFIRLKGIAV